MKENPGFKIPQLSSYSRQKWEDLDLKTKAKYSKKELREKEKYQKAKQKWDDKIAGNTQKTTEEAKTQATSAE